MSFQEPAWLFLTPILLLLFGGMVAYGFRRRDALLGRFAASRLLDQLTEQASLARTWIKAGCVLVAVVAIGVALARPQLGVEWSERKARGLDIVFVLDSSKSMLATDLRPTRLDRAKLAIIDLVERLESDRIGLVAFAGQAFLQTPPTLDYSAFRESLDAIDPNIMTSGGSDLGNAIKEAAEAFPSENNVKVVVLLTDGEDLGGNAAKAAAAAREDGIQVFAIGIGTPEGEYLKIRNEQGIEEFLRDAEGQPVRSQLDETTLQAIAQATGGSYSRLSSESLDQLYRSVIATLPRTERESELQEIHIERFQWALSAAMLFLVLEILIRRRRSAAIHASLFILIAFGVSSQEANAQMTQPIEGAGRPQADTPRATDEPTDPRSSYNAAYKAINSGDYEAATKGYETALSQTDDLSLQRDALYNMAHATYQQGRSSYESGDPQKALEQMKKAEALFNSAQEIDPADKAIAPDLEQVSKVRKAIEKLIEQQQQQEDQQEQSDQSEDSEDSKQEGDQSDQQQEDQSDQQDQQQSDQQNQQQSDQQDQQQDQQQGDQQDEQSGDQSKQSAEDPSNQTDPSEESNPSEDKSDQSQAAEQESTQDPVDDIPQPQPGEDAAEEGQAAGVPEPTEGEAAEEGQAGTGSVSGEPIEGMTEAEASALLDSLRGKETLLPFIDQRRSSNPRDVRDW